MLTHSGHSTLGRGRSWFVVVDCPALSPKAASITCPIRPCVVRTFGCSEVRYTTSAYKVSIVQAEAATVTSDWLIPPYADPSCPHEFGVNLACRHFVIDGDFDPSRPHDCMYLDPAAGNAFAPGYVFLAMLLPIGAHLVHEPLPLLAGLRGLHGDDEVFLDALRR